MKVFPSQREAAAYAEKCKRQGRIAAITPTGGGFVVRSIAWNREPQRGPWRDVRTPLRIKP
jgi:hypothetical protein